VLRDGSLTYYQDHLNTTGPAKGDLLLVPDSTVQIVSSPGQAFCFMITSAFDSLVMSTSNIDERDSWIKAIEFAIMKAHKCIRAYITKKGDNIDIRRSRKFFVLNAAVITWHQDHENTSVTQGSMNLYRDIIMSNKDDSCEILLANSNSHET
jgi:hypothetical protein